MPVAENLPASFDGEVVRGRLFLRTNLDAPTYRLYDVDPEHPDRTGWRELVAPGTGRGARGRRVTVEPSGSELSRASIIATPAGRSRRGASCARSRCRRSGSLFGVGGEWDGRELFYGFSSYTVPPSVYRIDLETGAQSLWRRVEADVDPGRFRGPAGQCPSKDGTPISMFLVHQKGVERQAATIRSTSPATAASTSA